MLPPIINTFTWKKVSIFFGQISRQEKWTLWADSEADEVRQIVQEATASSKQTYVFCMYLTIKTFRYTHPLWMTLMGKPRGHRLLTMYMHGSHPI